VGGISSCFLYKHVLWHLSLHSSSCLSCIYNCKLLFGLSEVCWYASNHTVGKLPHGWEK
jgi:hypothetical protein